mmetsp:Transcript_5255/g.13210  ORF Transcript_5255/g.13210 Transcript_5255/m.13210 type:complete len:178 (-) Transcript_5255:360-893(-)
MQAPHLTVGRPVDFSADVPVFPPVAALMSVMTGLIMWSVTRKRLRFLAWPMDALALRFAVFASAVAVFLSIVHASAEALDANLSGVDFVPVGGLAKSYPFDSCRNPMYSALVFVLLPAACALLDSLWPALFAPALFGYLHGVVIAAEEKMLLARFGAEYASYCHAVNKWSFMGLWNF